MLGYLALSLTNCAAVCALSLRWRPRNDGVPRARSRDGVGAYAATGRRYCQRLRDADGDSEWVWRRVAAAPSYFNVAPFGGRRRRRLGGLGHVDPCAPRPGRLDVEPRSRRGRSGCVCSARSARRFGVTAGAGTRPHATRRPLRCAGFDVAADRPSRRRRTTSPGARGRWPPRRPPQTRWISQRR